MAAALDRTDRALGALAMDRALGALAMDRALGALGGPAPGDAAGMAAQTMAPEAIRAAHGTIAGLVAPAPGHPVSHGLVAGSVTDDTEQALIRAAFSTCRGRPPGRRSPRSSPARPRGGPGGAAPPTARPGASPPWASPCRPSASPTSPPAWPTRASRSRRRPPPSATAWATRWASPTWRAASAARSPEALAKAVGTSVAGRQSVPAAFVVVRLAGGDPWRAALIAANIGDGTDTIGVIAGSMAGACAGWARPPPAPLARVVAVNRLGPRPLAEGLPRSRGP